MQKMFIVLMLCLSVSVDLMASLQAASSSTASSELDSEDDGPNLHPHATEQEVKRFLEDVKLVLIKQKQFMRKVNSELALYDNPKKLKKEKKKERRKQLTNDRR